MPRGPPQRVLLEPHVPNLCSLVLHYGCLLRWWVFRWPSGRRFRVCVCVWVGAGRVICSVVGSVCGCGWWFRGFVGDALMFLGAFRVSFGRPSIYSVYIFVWLVYCMATCSVWFLHGSHGARMIFAWCFDHFNVILSFSVFTSVSHSFLRADLFTQAPQSTPRENADSWQLIENWRAHQYQFVWNK